jgi:hypothetical protein
VVLNDIEMFRVFGAKVADEKDPQTLELLKQRLRLLLRDETAPHLPNNSKVE